MVFYRYAVSGKVNYSKYHPGKYLVAWHPKASTENERTTVVIENPVFGEILYRQVAGALAKRIIFLTGDTVNDETQQFLKSTGNPHISKPFQLANIQQVLKDTLAQPFLGGAPGTGPTMNAESPRN